MHPGSSGWVQPRVASALLGLLLVGLSGCVSPEPSAGNADPSPTGALEGSLTPTHFHVPLPRTGDQARYDAFWELTVDGQPHGLFEGEQVYRILDETEQPDGYGQMRSVYEVNLTSIQDGQQNYWETYWIDIASNQQIASRYGPDVFSGSRSNALLDLIRFEEEWTHTSWTTDRTAGNLLRDAGILGGLLQGQTIPRDGTWTRNATGLGAQLDFHVAPRPDTQTPGADNTFDLALDTTLPDGTQVALTATVGTRSPYTLSAERALRYAFPIAGSSLPVVETYRLELLNLTRGDAPLRPLTGPLTLQPTEKPTGEIGTTFPVGGVTFLAYEPEEGRAAAIQAEPEIAAWFDAHPDAFLSRASYFHGYAHHAWGGLYQVPEEQRNLVHIAPWHTVYTDPANGESLAFWTISYVASSSAAPPLYERHRFWSDDPSQQNLETFTRSDWLREPGGAVSLSYALDVFKETSPLGDTMPNQVEWITDPTGARYELRYVEEPATADSTLIENSVHEVPMHTVVVQHDGYRLQETTASLQWNGRGPI